MPVASSKKSKKQAELVGVRHRLGRPVRDATEALSMPLTSRDIAVAKRRKRKYKVNDPENFTTCALATCLSKIAGAEVAVMRRHAYVALPDEEFTLRYEVDRRATEIIHLNDQDRFDEIEPNVVFTLRAPSPRRRLGVQRANARAHGQYQGSRGSGRKQRLVDPFAGVVRRGDR